MTALEAVDLRSDLDFGARVRGATFDTLEDPEVREQLDQLFERRGLIVFEDVEPSSRMKPVMMFLAKSSWIS